MLRHLVCSWRFRRLERYTEPPRQWMHSFREPPAQDSNHDARRTEKAFLPCEKFTLALLALPGQTTRPVHAGLLIHFGAGRLDDLRVPVRLGTQVPRELLGAA